MTSEGNSRRGRGWRALAIIAALGLCAASQGGSRGLFLLRGAAAADRFGATLAAAGDVDGDGVGDLVVGAPHADVGGPSTGTVSVYSGQGGALLLQLHGDSPGARLGAAVVGLGDLDGDGHADLALGAPMGDPPAGSVRLVSGGTGALLWTRAGVAPGDSFGASLAALEDANGDGVPEILVGAPFDDGDGWNAGAVYLLSGRDGTTLRRWHGATWDQFGAALAAAGDVDGDGRGDWIVGAPFADVGAFNAGSAYVVSGADGTRLRALHGQEAGAQLGFAVDGAGDVDGDGRDDLLVVAPSADAGGIDSGAAYVYSGATGALVLVIPGAAAGLYLSAAVGVGDVDGDGRADLLVGCAADAGGAGRARLLSGRDGIELAAFDGLAPNDWFGAALARLGDLDGDGRDEFVVGAPGHDDVLGKPGYARAYSPPALGPAPDGGPSGPR